MATLDAVKESLRDGRKTWVHVNGRIYCVEEKRKGAVDDSEAANALVAPFSCKIIKLMANAGDTIKAGDPVLAVEAMKMEHTFTSPKDGTIKSFNVETGMIVDEGTNFVEWEA